MSTTAAKPELGVTARLVAFAVALVAVFVVAYFVADAVIPDSAVTRWEQRVAHDGGAEGGH